MIADALHVLLAEAEPARRRALASALEAAGHGVDQAKDADAAVRLAAGAAYDVVVLDGRLNDGDGGAVCRAIRKLHPAVPLLLIVGEDAPRSRDPGCGADGWLRRPFPPRELVSHVRGLRRRAAASMLTPERLDVDGVHLDLARRCVVRDGRPVALTAREVGILRWLYNHRTRAVSRAELLEEVWRVPGDLETRTVDMTISNLRRKIEPRAAAPRIIVTVKGLGYLWGAAD